MISQEPPREAVAPLPVVSGIVELYATLWQHLPALLQRIALPTAMSIVLLLLAVFLLPPLAAYVVWYLLLALPTTILGITWLRLLLLGDSKARFAQFDARHRRFFTYNFLLSLITLPLVFLQYWLEVGEITLDSGAEGLAETAPAESTADDLVYWLAYLPLLYMQLRLSFVLPAAAVDERYGFAESWRHTRSQSGRIFLIAVLAVLGPWLLWYYSPSWFDAPLWQFAGFLFYHLSIMLHQGAFYALLAIAFRTCTGWVPAPDRTILQRFE